MLISSLASFYLFVFSTLEADSAVVYAAISDRTPETFSGPFITRRCQSRRDFTLHLPSPCLQRRPTAQQPSGIVVRPFITPGHIGNIG